MSDVVTPGYAKLASQGTIINNPMTRIETFSAFTTCDTVQQAYTKPYAALANTSTVTGQCAARMWPDAFDSNRAKTRASEQIAINAAYAQASGGIAQLLVDLGEAHETLGMLGDTLRVAKALRQKSILYRDPKFAWREIQRDVKSLGSLPRGLQKAFETSNGYYLQSRYGWQPLLLSIIDTIEAVRAQTGTSIRITGRGFDQDSDVSVQGHNITDNPIGCGNIVTSYVETHDYLQENYRAGVLAEVTISRAKRLGLELRDVPSAALELIPYSFVVDWFVRIGDWLKAWSLPVDSKILATWSTHTSERITTRTQYCHDVSQSCGTGSTAKKYTFSGGSNQLTTVERIVQRRPNVKRSALPPIDRKTLSLLHSLDAIALGYQAFGRKIRLR